MYGRSLSPSYSGVNGDLPIVGKWTSGGYDRVGVFRPSTGYWYLDKNNDGGFTKCRKDQCAYLLVFVTGDLPVVGDWKGAGVSELGLFRPSTGQWFLDYNGNKSWNGCNNGRCIESFGTAGDQPVTGVTGTDRGPVKSVSSAPARACGSWTTTATVYGTVAVPIYVRRPSAPREMSPSPANGKLRSRTTNSDTKGKNTAGGVNLHRPCCVYGSRRKKFSLKEPSAAEPQPK